MPPPAALTAAPARIAHAGAADETIAVMNPGRATVVVDAKPTGFALDLRGRPRIVLRHDVGVRVVVRPGHVTLRPGETASIRVASVLRAQARVGDHPALVLLTTRPRGTGGVGVRVQLGVVVLVRVPGAVVHRVDVKNVLVRRHTLDVVVRNRGNVTESLGPRSFRLLLQRDGHIVAVLRPGRRELLPGAAGVVELRQPGRVRGVVRAVVELRSGSGALVRRAFILRGLRLPARAHAKARRAGARVHAGEPSRFGVLCTAVQCHERDTPSVARENDTRRAPA